MSKLTAYVFATDDEGETHLLAPGDELPTWAVGKVTNPDALDSAPAEPKATPKAAEPEEKKAPPRRAAKKAAE